MIERPWRSSSFARANTESAPSPLITFSRDARGRISALFLLVSSQLLRLGFYRRSAVVDNRQARTPVAPTTNNIDDSRIGWLLGKLMERRASSPVERCREEMIRDLGLLGV